MYSKAKVFINNFRAYVGDTTRDIPVNEILSWINFGLNELAREPGLQRLFTFHDAYDLASINTDGQPAAKWQISDDNIGDITDVMSLAILDSSGCELCPHTPCYEDEMKFHQHHPFPEAQEPGEPCYFTISRLDGRSYIEFDRPIKDPTTVSMVYTAYPPEVWSEDDILMISRMATNPLLELVRISYFREASDDVRARATYEDYDKAVYEVKQQLAKRLSATGQRIFEGAL